MAFVANLSKLMESGKLEIKDPVTPNSVSADVCIGDIYQIDWYKFEYGKEDWLQEIDRTLFGETDYIAFTKERITLSRGYKLHVDPRSSFARLGLQVTKFEDDELSKHVDASKLPYHERFKTTIS